MEAVTPKTKKSADAGRLDWRELMGVEQTKSELIQVMDSGRMHPVVMLEGREGLGKRHLASWMVARLLCNEASAIKKACGQCGSCIEVLSGTHPDVMILDMGTESIKTADVETMRGFFDMLSPGGFRVGVIMNADKMTLEASNRMLKTLEEPPEQARIIMTTSRPLGLPATVRGRCLRWKVKLPPRDTVIKWMRVILESSGQETGTDDDLRMWATRLGFSPGMIWREITDSSENSHLLRDSVHSLVTATSPSRALQAASDLARVQKVRVPELLGAVEWELSKLNRDRLSKSEDRLSSSDGERATRHRRRLLREIRRRAVFGKITFNAQLVAESIGLCQWEEGVL